MIKSEQIKSYINPPIGFNSLKDVENIVKDKECYTLCLSSAFDFVKESILKIIDTNTEGDICLAGVWRGGLAAYIQSLLIELKQDHKRKLILADTYSGFIEVSKNHPKDYKMYEYFLGLNIPTGSIHQVEQLFNHLNLHLNNVVFLEGDIKTTSKKINQPISFLLIDMDFYYPTYHGLKNIYPRVSKNGIIYIDDYNADVYECKEAVHSFLKENRLEPQIFNVNEYAISWTNLTE